MSSLTGLSPNNPRDYVGPNVALTTVVTRNREPTAADYRQPETGKLYPFNTFWLVGKNPTVGTQGDLWYLSKIVANVAYWLMVNASTATPLSVMVQSNTAPGVNPVLQTVGGLITVNGAIVANHAVPIETRSRALNTFNVEVQYSGSSVSTTANLSGLAHFNSAEFTVDANGFVSLSGSGLISSVVGTTNRITVNTVGEIATVDISASYVGQTSITTLGTVTTGVWNGTTIDVAYGGTSLNTLTNHAVMIGQGTSPVGFAGPFSSPGADNNAILMSNGASADPAFTITGTPYVSGLSFDSGTNTMTAYQSGSNNYGISIGGSNVGITYAATAAFFYLIGGMCVCAIPIVLSSTGGLTGDVLITNLPFNCSNTFGSNWRNTMIMTAGTLTAGYTNIFMVPIVGTNTAQLAQYNSATGASITALTHSNITNNSSFFGMFIYPVTD